ncbi:uncharacterized protein PpBr36_11506, partial [Pyricularia pennisetigena]|uniref:uncharacterized protein n=1 Tax=Pyricularia pennisetigena TaxID=1578925 RepID=UPI0011510437
MPSSGQERQRQHPKQRQQQNQQVQQQPIHSPPEPGCCGHIADAYGNFAVPRDYCENTRIVWQVCGCPPELADDDYNYGLANDEDTPATANN